MLQTISSWTRLARRLGISRRHASCQNHNTHRTLHFELLEEKRPLTTFFVDNLGDNGDGSLRDAITDANEFPGFDTITFNIDPAELPTDGSTPTINLLSEIDITDSVEIINPTGRDNLIIDGGDTTRLFDVSADTTFEGLTFTKYSVAA